MISIPEDLKKKINEAMSEKYVGNYIFSESEISQIYEISSTLLTMYNNESGVNIPSWFEPLIFVALVNVVKDRDDSEDGLWEYIFKKLAGVESSNKLYNYLTNLITRFGTLKKAIVLSSCKKKYYSTLLAHSFAPKKSTNSFFELCWEIYCEDMNQIYSSDDDIFPVVATQLKSKFSDEPEDDDDFQLGHHIYSFRAGIKGIATDRPEEMMQLIQKTIESLHLRFNGRSISTTGYLDNLIDDWWKVKESSFGENLRNHTGIREKAISDYSKIRAKYVFIDGKAILYIPPIRLKDGFDYNPFCSVFIEEKEVSSIEMYTKGSGLVMSTKPLEIDLSKFDEKSLDIRVVIEHHGNTIYDSNKTLKRPFILFKDNREILSQICHPGNYSLFLRDYDSITHCPTDIKKQSPFVYLIHAKDRENLMVDSKTIFFATESQTGSFWLSAKECKNISFRDSDEEYLVVNGFASISTGLDTKILDYGIRIDKDVYRFVDIPVEYDGDTAHYLISPLVDRGIGNKITIFRYSDNKVVLTVNIIVFNDILIEYDKKVYYDMLSSGELHFSAEGYEESINFVANQEEIIIQIESGDLIFYPPVIKWKIDSKDWNYEYLERGLWFEDFTNSSTMTISLPSNMSGELVLSNGSYVQSDANDIYKYKFGQTIYSNLDTHDFVVAILRLNDEDLIPLTRVFLKQQFMEDPFTAVDYYRYSWHPSISFIGRSSSSFKALISKDGKELETINLGMQSDTIDFSQYDEGFYNIQINVVGSGFFSPEIVLYKKGFVVGNEKNLKYKFKTLYINRAMLFHETAVRRISPFMVENIKFIGARDGNDYYSGTAFVISNDGHKLLMSSMKNDLGGYDKINPIRIEFRTDNTCWIVTGLKNDDIDDFQSEFTLDYSGHVSNRSKDVRGIDFFMFDVRGK